MSSPHFSHWKFSVAPMMDWTDKHCRFFHRLMTRHALLYTEMVTAAAIVHGKDAARFLAYTHEEHPIALQLGGSDPELLIKAIHFAEEYNYDEYNLNVGCPSDRVKSGSFGACLMANPELVAQCVTAMKTATNTPVTVKCRIGIDDQDVENTLPAFLQMIANAGVDGVIIHARKAVLGGLSPHQNRTIPPLNYPLVHEMKALFPQLPIAINGGLNALEDYQVHCNPLSPRERVPEGRVRDSLIRHSLRSRHLLPKGEGKLDGIMMGREAYQNPWILAQVDTKIFGTAQNPISQPQELLAPLCAYAETELAKGEILHRIAKHYLGLFQGLPGARTFRRILSEETLAKNAGPQVLEKAWGAVL